MPYTADKPPLPETVEQLRARIPGWGADLDPADRPAVPREQPGIVTGAHWQVPEDQPYDGTRERSVEHGRLPPVFGTAQPLTGASGVIRRYAYDRFSEARAAHWLLLLVADRVDVAESRVAALRQGRPDDVVGELGVRAELTHGGWSSRVGRGRSDVKHTWLDPWVAFAPLVVGAAAVVLARRALGRRRVPVVLTPSVRGSRRS